jgi:hypothetical protein
MSAIGMYTQSPQRADPLTWIVAFNLPLFSAITSGVGGLGIAAFTTVFGVETVPLVAATLLTVIACLLILRDVRPHRPNFTVSQCILPMSLGLVGMALSAWAHRDSSVEIGGWTGPLGVCMVMIALVPYCSALTLATLGLISATLAAGAGLWAFPEPTAGPVSLIIAGATLPLHVGLVGAVFSAMVVAAVIRWRALPYDREESVDRPRVFASRLREHGTPVVIGDDVLALLEKVAVGGRVTAKERTDAAALAAGIRSDLVTAIDRSWLDSIANAQRLIVEDPDRVANRMTREQRAAIHGLISAALESPLLAGEALRIELRSRDDGTTAVALSMNITLPEGKRVMMLAPYFVSLKASAHDLEWAGGEQLRMRFKLPAPPDNRGR